MAITFNSNNQIAGTGEFGPRSATQMSDLVNRGRHFVVGRLGWASSQNSIYGGLVPEDAWSIDSKMDDGKPASGSMISNGGNSNCGTSAAASADYRLSQTAIAACSLWFIDAF